MSTFDEYATKYHTVRMRREDNILEMQLHTDGGSWRWAKAATAELEEAFLDVGRDHENHVIILTGTGAEFSGPAVTPVGQEGPVKKTPDRVTPTYWDAVYWEGKHLLMNLLDIEVPMISVVNGPCVRHAEIPVMCDIVLAAEEAAFRDSAHFQAGRVPGDGMHAVFPLLMGLNRARYFLYMGQTVSAADALDFGLVNEVLPRQELLPRAWEIARQIMLRPPLVRKYTRILLTQDVKHRMHDLLGYGLAMEGLADSRLARAATAGMGAEK